MGQHFYKLDGTPFYTIKGANGKERPVTIRDVRKAGNIVPSVTTITSMLDKSALGRWKQTRLLDVVLEHKDKIGKHQAWKDELIGLSEERNATFAIRGNEIHNKLEDYYKTGNIDSKDYNILYPTIKAVEEKILKTRTWEAEVGFASPEGFGGKLDLFSKKGIVLDFKTKQGNKLGKDKLYNDYCMQLAAYREGMKKFAIAPIRCYNVLVSATDVCEPYIHEWSSEELDKGYEMFKCLLEFWKLSNGYDSSFGEENES